MIYESTRGGYTRFFSINSLWLLRFLFGFDVWILLFSRLGFCLFVFYFGIFITWIRGLFDGVKPTKGQDCGRSSFSCVHDRDRGSMEKMKCSWTNRKDFDKLKNFDMSFRESMLC
jgi:hypothetical protein